MKEFKTNELKIKFEDLLGNIFNFQIMKWFMKLDINFYKH